MLIRRAHLADALDVLTWRNDPLTRAMSKDSAVVAIASHLAWFTKAIETPERLLLIGEANGAKVGMVRFDLGAEGWLTSINVAPERRGQGLGGRLLFESIGFLNTEKGPSTILAEVNANNLPSLRLFEKNGFSITGRDGPLLHLSRISASASTTRSTS